MTKKHTFGEPLDEDILVLQGVEYHLQPFGMEAFRATLERQEEVSKIRELDGNARTMKTYELSVDLIVNAVVPDDREAISHHLDRSVPPELVSEIAGAIMRGMTDVDPTRPTSSSDGSSETGQDGTDGASPEASTPES